MLPRYAEPGGSTSSPIKGRAFKTFASIATGVEEGGANAEAVHRVIQADTTSPSLTNIFACSFASRFNLAINAAGRQIMQKSFWKCDW